MTSEIIECSRAYYFGDGYLFIFGLILGAAIGWFIAIRSIHDTDR